MILGFIPGLLDPFNAPKSAALRVLGLPMLAAVITAIAMARLRARSHALDFAVGAWVLVSMGSTLAGLSPRLSLLGEIEQREGLMTTLALAGLYAATRRSHASAEHVSRTLDTVWWCGALAAAYALLQTAGLDPLQWANPSTYHGSGSAVMRPFATLGNPILLGALIAAALPIGVARLASAPGSAWRDAPIVVLLSVASVATLSRGVWLAAAAGSVAALVGVMGRRRPLDVRRVVLAALAVAAPAAFWAGIVQRAPIAARLTEAGSAAALSGPARVEIARAAFRLWRAHPWLGTGPDTFGLAFPGVQSVAFWRLEWLGIPVHAHGVFFQVLATLGGLGVGAGAAWLACALFAAWRTPAPAHSDDASDFNAVAIGSALVALAIAGAFNPVGLAGSACFVVFSALAVCGSSSVLSAQPETALARALPRMTALAALLVTGFAAARELGALAPAGQARDRLDASTTVAGEHRAQLIAGSVPPAWNAAEKAPGEDELWRLACDASLAHAADRFEQREVAAAGAAAENAELAARRALRLEPARASNLERLANALAMRARIEPADSAVAELAEAAFAAASALAPVDGLMLVERAQFELATRRADRALVTAERIVALYPEAATGHALEAAAFLALGRRAEARAALVRALAARWDPNSEREHAAATQLMRAFEGRDSTPR